MSYFLRSFKLVPFDSLGGVSYSPSIVTIALPRMFSEIKRDTGRKSRFFIPPLAFDAPIRGPRRNTAIPFGVEKLEWWGYPMVKKLEDIYNRLHRILEYRHVTCD